MPYHLYISLALILSLLLSPLSARAAAPDFKDEIKQISNRHSQYLDSAWSNIGWIYNVPSRQYREINQNSFNNLRLQTTLAAFYRGRNDEASLDKIRQTLSNVLIDLPPREANHINKNGRDVSTRSFNQAIGCFLALQILEAYPELFTFKEKETMLANIKAMLLWALKAEDTENRALLGAAYGLAVLNHPLFSFTVGEQAEYLGLIKNKVSVGLKAIDKNGVYREGAEKKMSSHYQLVSAAMLFYLGDNLPEPGYRALAVKMTVQMRAQYPPGRLSWRGSGRPTGLGLQSVLLRALNEKLAGNAAWYSYWQAEKRGRGFIDPKRPDRLVWRDDADRMLNDDYSFASIAELFRDRL